MSLELQFLLNKRLKEFVETTTQLKLFSCNSAGSFKGVRPMKNPHWTLSTSKFYAKTLKWWCNFLIKGQKRIKIFQSANSTYNDWWSPHVVEHCQTTFFTQMQPKNRFTSRKGTFHVVNLCPRTLIYFTTIRAIKKSSRVNPQLLRSFFINNAPCSSRFYLQPINRRNFRPQLDMCRGLRFEINVLIRRKHPDWIKKCEDFVIEHHLQSKLKS